VRPADLDFLRSASGIPWPDLSQAATFDDVPGIVEEFERDASPAWHQSARECDRWAGQVTRVLEDLRAVGYCPSQPPESTAAAIGQASTALGALSIILRDSVQEIGEEDRALLERIAADVAVAAASVFSRAAEAWDLITADASVDRPS
jgi:hypothetical protein